MSTKETTPEAFESSSLDTDQTKSTKKNFILDTNVILHDHECIDKFEENDIYIPIIVLEELDHFKKGGEQINYNARAFVRKIDDLGDMDFFENGVSLGSGRGKLFIYISNQCDQRVKEIFSEDIPDHRVLSMALAIAAEHPDEKTILVTKDMNLRMKARALGIPVEDYINDKVVQINAFGSEEEEIYSGVSADLIDHLYAQREGIEVEEWEMSEKLEPNQCFIMRSERNSIMVRHDPFAGRLRQIPKRVMSGIIARNSEQAFAFEILSDPNIKLIGLSGKAGTGKTLLALAAALAQSDDYKQVLLARPIVSLANKDIGFLPGDEKSKIEPYMRPLFDNLNVIKFQLANNPSEIHKIEDMQNSQKLVIEALAFIRGRSLAEAICIIDEAQNLTPQEVKTIITRAGEGTKMIFTGDFQQIDSPYLDAQSNGLAYMIDRMRGQQIFAHVNLVKGERSELSELASDLL